MFNKWYDLADAGRLPDMLHARKLIIAHLSPEVVRKLRQTTLATRQIIQCAAWGPTDRPKSYGGSIGSW